MPIIKGLLVKRVGDEAYPILPKILEKNNKVDIGLGYETEEGIVIDVVMFTYYKTSNTFSIPALMEDNLTSGNYMLKEGFVSNLSTKENILYDRFFKLFDSDITTYISEMGSFNMSAHNIPEEVVYAIENSLIEIINFVVEKSKACVIALLFK